MEEVGKTRDLDDTNFFSKVKGPGQYGLPVEIFLGWYEFIE